MDFSESQEHAAIREAVRKIAQEFGHEYYVAQSRSGQGDSELWNRLGEAGFLGVSIPERYGGGGGGVFELSIVAEEVAAAGCPMLMLVVSPAICARVIERFGSCNQRDEYLPRLATGELTLAFAITEPDAGTNSHAISTRAVPADDGGWIITGTKYYISGLDTAEAFFVVARTDMPAENGHGLSTFIVPKDADRLHLSAISVEVTSPDRQYFVHMDGVHVSQDALIGAAGAGLEQLFVGLNPERVMSASMANGIGRYAIDKAAKYARARHVWDHVPIGAYQGVAHPLARAQVALEQSRLITQKAAWQCDGAEDAGALANIAKLASSEAGLFALDTAIQTHGGNGMATEYGLATLWGTTRLLRIAPVTTEMVLNHIAQHSLRLPKSY